MTTTLVDIAAEGGVLGSMLLDRNQVDVVRRMLAAEDFGKLENQIIAGAVFALAETVKGDIDCVLVRNYLTQRQLLDAAGGVEYLQRLIGTLPTAANAEYYARIVKDYADRREIARIAQDAIAKCLNPNGLDAEKIRCGAVQGLSEANKGFGSMQTMAQVFGDIDFETEKELITTGFAGLDSAIAGYAAGQFVTVAGRPGMGKSAFLAACAMRAAFHDHKVLYFSMEMTADDIVRRMACAQVSVDVSAAFRGGRWLTDWQKDKLEEAKKTMKRLPVRYNCRTLTPARLRGEVLSALRQEVCDIVFVDYLGLMRPDNPKMHGRYEIVSDISNAMKQIALDCKVPLVVGCQLNREVAKVGDKRPMLQHLRDSGAIEQDSDVVLFLHRPTYYYTPEERKAAEDNHTLDDELCEIIVAKNRNGGSGIINLNFEGRFTRFEERQS